MGTDTGRARGRAIYRARARARARALPLRLGLRLGVGYGHSLHELVKVQQRTVMILRVIQITRGLGGQGARGLGSCG